MPVTYHLRELFSKNLFFKNGFLLSMALLSLVVHLLFWYAVASFFIPRVSLLDQPQIPLHYTIYFNIDYYGDYRYIYPLGLFGLILFFSNFFISVYAYKNAPILSVISILSGLAFQIGLVWYLYLILRFNSYI